MKSPARKGLNKAQRNQVVALVKGQAETKRATFYQTANNGTVTTPATGIFGTRGWAQQNNNIVSNNTDILQLIPYVSQGINDWQRIGQKIRPVSLQVKGAVRINMNTTQTPNQFPTNLHVDIYCLQHVGLKNYLSLRANNDFQTLLQNGEGGTAQYTGSALDPHLPVNAQNYKVLARKRITLKFANYFGVPAPAGAPTFGAVSIANSGQWYADYTIDLTKHLPAQLTYPEATLPVPLPTVDDAPTNCAFFMAMAFVSEVNVNPPETTRFSLEQTYVASMLFKDM